MINTLVALKIIIIIIIIIIMIIIIIVIRRVDVSHCPLVKRPTHGRRHCCRLTHWRSGQKEPWRIQGWLIIIGLEIVDEAFIYLGLYLPGSVKAIANCDILIHRFSGKWMTNTSQHFHENIHINGELDMISYHIEYNLESGLHLLLCAGTVAFSQAAPTSPKLSTPRGPRGTHTVLSSND